MSYKIVIFEDSVNKDYEVVMASFSKEVKKRTVEFIKTTPYFGKKRKQFYKHDLPQGNRILYMIISNKPPVVRIVCIGNHNHYMKYLKKHGK